MMPTSLAHTRDPWMADAACKDEDPDDWYERGESDHYAHARTVCATCPVATWCLDYALRHEQGRGVSYRAGLWAGTTPQERASADPSTAYRRAS